MASVTLSVHRVKGDAQPEDFPDTAFLFIEEGVDGAFSLCLGFHTPESAEALAREAASCAARLRARPEHKEPTERVE